MKEKCTKCGSEATYLDIDNKSWVCQECYNNKYKNIDLDQYRKERNVRDFPNDLDKILDAVTKLFDTVNQSNIEAMDRRFEKTPYSRDLNKLLLATTKSELIKISESLGLRKLSKLKKNELVNLIMENYEERLLCKLELLDEKSYKTIKSFIKFGDQISLEKINSENESYIDYLLELGVVFTTKDNNGMPVFIIPSKAEAVIKQLDEFKYRLKIKQNTKIVNLYTGMIRIYGLLEKYQIIQFIKRYVDDNSKHLENILIESSKYNMDYEIKGMFVYSSKIGSCTNLFNDINKYSGEINYADYDEETILSFSKVNWEIDNKYAREFKEKFLDYFELCEDEIDDFLQFLYAIVQERSVDEIICEIRDMIKEEEAKEIGVEIIKNYIVNIPIWLRKGLTIRDLS